MKPRNHATLAALTGLVLATAATNAAPLPYTTGLDVWLDASDMNGNGDHNAGWSISDALAVGSKDWVNKGSAGNPDAYGYAGAGAPTYSSEVTLPLGGNAPAVQFSTDNIRFTEFMNSPTFSIFAVVQSSGNGTGVDPIFWDYGSNSDRGQMVALRLDHGGNGAGTIGGYVRDSTSSTKDFIDAVGTSDIGARVSIVEMILSESGGASTMEVGPLGATAMAGHPDYESTTTWEGTQNPPTIGTISGGTAHTFAGNLFEILIFDHAVAGADRTAVEDYLIANYNTESDPKPSISSFVSDTHRLQGSGSATLSWETEEATSLTITPDVGDVTAQTVDGVGSISVSPAETVTYTLTATNAEGPVTASAGIRVISETGDRRPNIILFHVDDMGWNDTSLNFHTSETIYNRRYITPSMETLASRGVRFTNAYAAATICQCSRYALMSGLLPATSGYTYNGAGSTTATIKPPPFAPTPIDQLETLPRSIQALGYETIQMGKWHIAGTNSNYSANILASGFNRKIAANDAGQPGSYLGTSNFGSPGAFQVPDLEEYHGQNVFLTEAITLEANKAIEETVSKGKPFFLFLSHYAIHTPIQADVRFTSHYDGAEDGDHYIANSTERSYATMIEGMDKSLGDIMAKLTALGVDEDTLIIFSSDHGGLTFTSRGPSAYPNGTFPPTGIAVSNQSHNYPLRYGKGWTYEGGVRVPMIVSWGNPNPANPIQTHYPVRTAATEDRPVSQLDFFPTLVNAAGGTAPGTVHGADVSHYLSGAPGNDRPIKLLWHQPHYRPDHNIPHSTSMRYGNWKVVHRIESATWELYDLSADIGETNDLAGTHPRELALYSREMVRELEKTGALYPTRVSDGTEIRPIPAVAPAVDVDFDGVPDIKEDPNGNGIIDAGETDPSLFDHFSSLQLKITPEPDSTDRALSAVRQTSAGGVLGMQMEQSTDLIAWNDYLAPSQISDNGDNTETLFWPVAHLDGPGQFFRLQIDHLELIP